MEGAGAIEVRRVELADLFGCAPSQISYVLETRFTLERGYIVESRRGGGGYIRIKHLECPSLGEVLEGLRRMGGVATQAEALHMIERLEMGGQITGREAGMLRQVVDRKVLGVPLPERDALRFRVLAAMLGALFTESRESGGYQNAL